MNQDLKYWIAITRHPKIGAIRFKKLYNFFPDLKTAWEQATLNDLKEAGIEENLAEDFLLKKKDINPDQELELLKINQVNAITIQEAEYPSLLKEIYGAPPVIFYRGDLTKYHEQSLAIVGTRNISSYGHQIVNELITDLSSHEINIVSGLALGVDTQAHLAALKNNLTTIAVLASGLDEKNIYPGNNRRLAQNIIEKNGLIISEFPIGTMPLKHHFPIRNRIISGLSRGTLIIEAGETSGALITAHYALEQNREVLAIPGNISNLNSLGTNNLIKQGAKMVTGVNDVLEIFQFPLTTPAIKEEIKPANEIEAKILTIISDSPTHIDKIVALSGLPASTINANLTIMEMQGKISNIGNMNFIKN